MFLALQDLSGLFLEKKGVEDDFLFHTVADHADVLQPRGLFIPLSEDSGELSEAIANGAIAAIWPSGKELPRYTPNHFPVFFTEDNVEALTNVLQLYIDKLNGETEKKMEITNFKFSHKELLNKNRETYDIAVMLKQLSAVHENDPERRG